MASWRFAVGCTGKRVTMFFLWRYKKVLSDFMLYVVIPWGLQPYDPLIKSHQWLCIIMQYLSVI